MLIKLTFTKLMLYLLMFGGVIMRTINLPIQKQAVTNISKHAMIELICSLPGLAFSRTCSRTGGDARAVITAILQDLIPEPLNLKINKKPAACSQLILPGSTPPRGWEDTPQPCLSGVKSFLFPDGISIRPRGLLQPS